jgi:hypothetical protein
MDKIQLWPYFNVQTQNVSALHEFVSKQGLTLTPRGKISGGIALRYPLPIALSEQADIERAIPVLQFSLQNKNHSDEFKSGSGAQFRKAAPSQSFPDELIHPGVFPEGGRKTIIVNAYERSGPARSECIKHYGPKCRVCELDFEKRYGKLGKGFIHVHHIFEISKVGKKYKVDPQKDLRPVCPNCHAMLHRNNPMLSIEELKARFIDP